MASSQVFEERVLVNFQGLRPRRRARPAAERDDLTKTDAATVGYALGRSQTRQLDYGGHYSMTGLPQTFGFAAPHWKQTMKPAGAIWSRVLAWSEAKPSRRLDRTDGV